MSKYTKQEMAFAWIFLACLTVATISLPMTIVQWGFELAYPRQTFSVFILSALAFLVSFALYLNAPSVSDDDD